MRSTALTKQRSSTISIWTAVRGVAALWVVLMHFGSHFSPAINGPVVLKGYLAVDLFFVLSGMVMFHVYHESIERNSFSFRQYIYKRFARLYPVHFVTLVFATLVILGGNIMGLSALPEQFVYDFVANALMIHAWGVTEGMSLNYPSWSISAEFFAYLIFLPVTVALLRFEKYLSLIFGVALFCSLAVVIQKFGIPSGRSVPPGDLLITRLTYDMSVLRILPEFILGILVCRIVVNLPTSDHVFSKYAAAASVSLFAILVLALYIKQDAIFVLIAPIFLGTLYIWNPEPPRPLVYLGEISYSIYMGHALVQMVGFTVLEHSLKVSKDAVPVVFAPIMLLIAILFGSALFHLVEVPSRRIIVRRLKGSGTAAVQL